MRFFLAKNDNRDCKYCGSNIIYGEHYVLSYFHTAKRTFFFHIECYRQWIDEKFVKKYLEWKENLNPPAKRGRPPTYKDGKLIHQLKALRRYHTRVGNEDTVRILDGKIQQAINEN